MKLLEKLPKSYSELPYKDYITIIQTIPSEIPQDWSQEDWNIYFNLTVLSILLDAPVTDLERLPASEIIELIKGICYLDKPVKPAKTRLKCKSVNELTYDEYINFQKLRLDPWANMEEILSILVKENIPDNLSTQDAFNVFFCLNNSTRRFMIYSLISLGWKILVTKIKNLIPARKKVIL